MNISDGSCIPLGPVISSHGSPQLLLLLRFTKDEVALLLPALLPFVVCCFSTNNHLPEVHDLILTEYLLKRVLIVQDYFVHAHLSPIGPPCIYRDTFSTRLVSLSTFLESLAVLPDRVRRTLQGWVSLL